MVKIGVMTDLHLGVRPYGLEEREEDFYDQYMIAINTLIENNINILILGGDIFDQPRPSPKALRVFSEGLQLLFNHNIEVLNIIGNHAMIQAPGFVTADEFLLTALNSDKYHLLDKDYFYNSGVFIAGLPYYFNYQLDDLINEVNNLNHIAGESNNQSILVLHQSFKEFCGFTGEKLSINDINVDNFDLIICGHIHEKKIIEVNNNTVYLQPGSLERLSVAEARDEEINGKGVFIFEGEDINIETISNAFLRLKSDRQFLISDMYMSNKDKIEEIRNEILEGVQYCRKPPIMFLSVHDSSKSFQQLIELTKDLKDDCLTVNFNYFDESVQENDFIIDNKDLPSAREVLRLALNPLEEDEAQLGLDLFDLLKDEKDASKLLEDFLNKKREKNAPEENVMSYQDDEINEIFEYFENL